MRVFIVLLEFYAHLKFSVVICPDSQDLFPYCSKGRWSSYMETPA